MRREEGVGVPGSGTGVGPAACGRHHTERAAIGYAHRIAGWYRYHAVSTVYRAASTQVAQNVADICRDRLPVIGIADGNVAGDSPAAGRYVHRVVKGDRAACLLHERLVNALRDG